MSSRLRSLVVAAAGALVLAGGGVAISQAGKRDAEARTTGHGGTAALYAGIPQDGIALGRPDAPVTLEEFADLQCAYCRDYARDVLPTVVRDYVRTGKVRLVFRNLAFLGPDSERGARMAEAAARQDRLFQFVDRFYAEQGTENSGYVTGAFLEKVAGQVPGLDVDRALADAPGESLDAAEDRALAFHVESTPSFLIGRTGGTPRPLAVHGLDAASLGAALDRLLRA